MVNVTFKGKGLFLLLPLKVDYFLEKADVPSNDFQIYFVIFFLQFDVSHQIDELGIQSHAVVQAKFN